MMCRNALLPMAALSFALLLLQTQHISASAGYHYEPPTAAPPTAYSGHHFGPLPTVAPLPPVPALPALPTPPAGLYQSPAPPSQLQIRSPARQTIANAYIPASHARPTYQHSSPIVSKHVATSTGFGGSWPSAPSAPGRLGVIVPSAPAAGVNVRISSGPTAAAQPLRQQQLLVQYPTAGQLPSAPSGPAGNTYVANGRQLKQYEVVEIIDNDIEHHVEPFLPKPFLNNIRTRFDDGIGADAFSGHAGIQLDSRANTLLIEQQNLAALRPAAGDAVALGSGSLGYIRLPNGNVYLGSGSLGFISGQQRLESVRDARTRTGAPLPNALHFGHGALGGGNFYRFK